MRGNPTEIAALPKSVYENNLSLRKNDFGLLHGIVIEVKYRTHDRRSIWSSNPSGWRFFGSL